MSSAELKKRAKSTGECRGHKSAICCGVVRETLPASQNPSPSDINFSGGRSTKGRGTHEGGTVEADTKNLKPERNRTAAAAGLRAVL